MAFLSLVTFFFLLETGLRLSGAVIQTLQESQNLRKIYKKGGCRILCLGESTTALGGEYSYPAQLEKILNSFDCKIKFSVINKGIIGTVSKNILSDLDYNLAVYAPDLVVVMMGINDKSFYHFAFGNDTLSEVTLFLYSLRTVRMLKIIWTRLKSACTTMVCYGANNDARLFIQRHIGNDDANNKQSENYLTLGQERLQHDDLNGAIEMVVEALKYSPRDDGAYYALGKLYQRQGNYVQAAAVFRKTIDLNPKHEMAYLDLGWCNLEQGNFVEAEDVLRKCTALNPLRSETHYELGRCYLYQKKHNLAEKKFAEAINLTPSFAKAYNRLGDCYEEQKKFPAAAASYKKSLELNYDTAVCLKLARMYMAMGDHALAAVCCRNAKLFGYHPATVQNFLRINEKLKNRNIRLVCVQYPMRSIQPLKKIFDEQDNVIFVDNEGIFNEAIKRDGSEEYFKDMFAGDFGHCTPKGNRLLAKNIASVIMCKVFNKRHPKQYPY